MRVLVVTSILLCAAGARGAEVTRVVSALDDENRFDFNVTLAWLHEIRSADIKHEGKPLADGTFALDRDSKYEQRRDILDLQLAFGILWDVGLRIGAPLVLADDRSLSLDGANSRILSDGILPSTRNADGELATYGLNAGTGMPFTPPSSNVFRGPRRRGFESLNLGLTWAVFNQRRDDTRPTWTLNFDALLDVFKDMRFDSGNPGANTAVGLGYHQFIWSTYVSKRFRYFEPYFGGWYMLPVRTNHSIYSTVQGAEQGAINPQMRAAVVAGVEQIAWENPRAWQRVTVEVRGRAVQYFFGRSASELWEPLIGSQQCAKEMVGCRPNIDSNPGDTMFRAHPGVTETQAYASFGGDAGLNIQVGRYARFRGLFGLMLNQSHYITYASSGIDASNANYREAIDAPGRRFKVEGSKTWQLFLEGSLMF